MMKGSSWLRWGFWVAVLVGGGIGLVEIWHSYQLRSWEGVSRFTVVRVAENQEDIQVLSVDPETKAAVRLVLPGEMEIPTVGGKGVWKISSLPELAQKNGWKWAGDSVADFLSVPYTAAWEEMSFWDKLAWSLISSGVEWKEVNLVDTSWVVEFRDPDGAKVLGLSGVGQKKVGQMFYSSRLAKEGLQVGVFNTTTVTGLGLRVARVVENAGLKVVKVGEQAGEVERCLVSSNVNLQENIGVRWLMRNFNCEWRGDRDLEGHEVDILVGRQYVNWLLGE
jgi:hypothetical protein